MIAIMIIQVTLNQSTVDAIESLAEAAGKAYSDIFTSAFRLAAADQLDLGAALNARKGRAETTPVRRGFYLAKKDADVPVLLQQLEQTYHLARADVARLVLEAYIAHLESIHPADRQSLPVRPSMG